MTAARWRDAVGTPRAAGWVSTDAVGMQVTVWVAAAVGGLLAVLTMVGHLAGVRRLETLFLDLPAARFNAALAILLLSLGWFLPRIVRAVFASVALLIAVVTVVEQVGSVGLGVDQLFVDDPTGLHPGRMSVLSAVTCCVIAVAVLLTVAGRLRPAEYTALAVLAVGCVVLLGYAYDVSVLSNNRSVSRVAPSTAVGYVALAVATLAAVPRGRLEWVATGQDAGAHLLRRLLPLALLGLPAMGLLCVLGERHGMFKDAETSALIVILAGAAVAGLTWFAARSLTHVDKRRARAIAELTELRIDLERQVQERAELLQRRHDEIAVLEDRQRIAADLHDIVIQRLFAAGMYLQSGAQDADPDTRRRLDSAVETMDVAIKDLRASIFELGGRVHHPIDVTTAVSDVCTESARVLGFDPDVLIDDPDEDAEPLREDILAVLREALANVARHAEATLVDVVLRVGDGQLWLTVTDNGKGISEQAHRSGTRNMELRAREHGGECSWTRTTPHGTRVLWRVPVGV